MKNIDIKRTPGLKKLGFLLGGNEADIVERMLKAAIEDEVIFDDSAYCGETLMSYFKDAGFSPFSATLYSLCKHTKEIEDLFKNLLVWGKANVCPLCGCKLETEEILSYPDYEDGHRDVLDTIEHCSNKFCKF